MNRSDLLTILDKTAFVFDRSSYPIIEVGGKEHREWIHRITSQASLKSPSGDVVTTAFLNGTAGVIAYFQMLILDDKVWILAEPQAKEKILKHLDFSHFGEDIYFKSIEVNSYFEILGQHTEISSDFNFAPETWNTKGRIYINASQMPDLPKMDIDTYHMIKRSKAWPIDQLDIGETQVLLEAEVLSAYASDTKGCYPGQEVIAKIITYGRVAKKYMALWSKEKPALTEISYKDGKAGQIIHVSPLNDGYLILAYVLRVAHDNFKAGGSLTVADQALTAFTSQP